MILITEREVQVLREAICLEVTLLKTGAALEDPAFRKLFMRADAGEYPAEGVVLLDNVWQQRKRRRGFEDFAPVDHEADCLLADGNHRRQAVTSFFGGSEGSSWA